ncbi:hypothetical protein AAID93_05075 [Campylobacter coli]
MGVFRKFYIVWVVFCISGFAISPAVGHNPNRVYEFFCNARLDYFPFNSINALSLFFSL